MKRGSGKRQKFPRVRTAAESRNALKMAFNGVAIQSGVARGCLSYFISPFVKRPLQGLAADLLEAARRRNLSANTLAAYELKASRAYGCGRGESTSRDRRWSGMARPLATRPSTYASSSPASARGYQSFPLTPCGIRPPPSFLTSAEPTCSTSRRSSAIRVLQQPRATRTLIPSGCARSWETSDCTPSLFCFPMSQVRPKGEKFGEIPAKAVVQLLFSTGKSFTVDGLCEKLREFFRQEVRAELRAVAASTMWS
jgi:hypothetical protein